MLIWITQLFRRIRRMPRDQTTTRSTTLQHVRAIVGLPNDLSLRDQDYRTTTTLTQPTT